MRKLIASATKTVMTICTLGALAWRQGAQRVWTPNWWAIATTLILFCSASLFGQTTLSFQSLDERYDRSSLDINTEKLPEDIQFLSPSRSTMEALTKAPDDIIYLDVPVSKQESVSLAFSRRSIFAPGAKVRSSDGLEEFDLVALGDHFAGKVVDEDETVAALSIFDGVVNVTFAYRGLNYNLEQIQFEENDLTAPYVLYPEPQSSASFTCHTDDFESRIELPPGVHADRQPTHARSVAPISIYLECDYKTYLDKGGTTGASNYVTGLFNVVAGIYDDANVTVVISEIKVWNSPDPYGATSGNNSLEVLNAFESENCSYNGHIAHLLSTSSANLGGIANRPSCNGGSYTGTIHGFSNISTTYSSNLNIYSWSVNVLAHELGHNMSSPHTHACSWNGNNTQIDDCGNAYISNPGSCYTPSAPIIPPKGTIMSYCHLGTGNGIDLSTGFHSQVADKIFEFAGCLSNGSTSCPTPPANDLSVSFSGQDVTLHCGMTSGISYYYWGYRSLGSSSYTYSPGSTTSNEYTISGLSDGDYEFIVVLYCSASGWGAFSCPKAFSVGGDCPAVVELSEVPIPSGTYGATSQIMADGMIMNNGQVTLSAGNAVTLESGFEISLGGTVDVVMDGCP
ncbi:MAG: hypothetical protein HKN87_18255 [Saprospiraceae bacterium]|nr:hypothetical protein [Saprospiraceae bacterium]